MSRLPTLWPDVEYGRVPVKPSGCSKLRTLWSQGQETWVGLLHQHSFTWNPFINPPRHRLNVVEFVLFFFCFWNWNLKLKEAMVETLSKNVRADTAGLWHRRHSSYPEYSRLFPAGSALSQHKHSPSLWNLKSSSIPPVFSYSPRTAERWASVRSVQTHYWLRHCLCKQL